MAKDGESQLDRIRNNEEILQVVHEKGSLIGTIRNRQRKRLSHINEGRLPPKNYNRGKNRLEKDKRKRGEIDVIGGGLQRVEGETDNVTNGDRSDGGTSAAYEGRESKEQEI